MRKGFTLVEMIVIICIIAVLALLSAPSIMGTITSSQTQVCKDNRSAVVNEYYSRRSYTENLKLKQVLGEYKEVCPSKGIISVNEGTSLLTCSKHK